MRNIAQRMRYAGVVCAACCFLLFISCDESRVYEKNLSIDKNGWSYDDDFSFTVNILDTASAYNMFVNVRHTDAYPYNNLWVKLITVFPDSTKEESKLNVFLSKPEGNWTGQCVDGMCFNTALIQKNFTFPQAGTYTFILEQDMRMDPLPYVTDIGLKVEKFK
ncbi:MAG: gliding motility lipoprotein GldH [Chitinophagales bacterium]